MEKNVTLFQCPFMDLMNSRDRTKQLKFCYPKKKLTVYLTVTSNSKHYSLDTNDDDEDDLPTWRLSNTNDEENDDTEDPIDPSKPSPIAECHTPYVLVVYYLLLG